MTASSRALLAPGEPPARARSVSRWAAALMLLPLPLWFIVTLVRDSGPAWRAEYRGHPVESASVAVVAERQLSRYWDKRNKAVPGGINVGAFSARWDSCLRLEGARQIPFMLVANGVARFTIDGDEKLLAVGETERRTSGAVISLDPGVHHLSVTFQTPRRGWPTIALLASFDDRAPLAIASGTLTPGVHMMPAVPGNAPCESAR